jgi:hypothetical protein
MLEFISAPLRTVYTMLMNEKQIVYLNGLNIRQRRMLSRPVDGQQNVLSPVKINIKTCLV